MTNEVLSRRLAVIVAADVVGYSRLMEADEAGTLAQLKSIRKELIDPKIAEHRGRLVKTTGDGLLMEFFSVTDGVQGAIEIQEALAERNAAVPPDRRLQFRIGINLGEIITEGEDIYGTGVNVAARLESLADPGDICVSASVGALLSQRGPRKWGCLRYFVFFSTAFFAAPLAPAAGAAGTPLGAVSLSSILVSSTSGVGRSIPSRGTLEIFSTTS